MILYANPTSIEIQAKLFRGFSDPSRLMILSYVRDGARTVSEIVTATGLSQSNVPTTWDACATVGWSPPSNGGGLSITN
jgi:DNA-binding transcriptional ArsR family regulator